MKTRRNVFLGIGVVTILATAFLTPQVTTQIALARAGTGYVAKSLCSGVLLAGMDPQRLLDQELVVGRGIVSPTFLEEDGEVIASAVFGLISGRAKRHGDLGCSLYYGGDAPVAIGTPARLDESGPAPSATPWPISPSATASPPIGIDEAALRAALDDAFSEPDADNPRRTRGVIVVQDGWVVAERYAPGITYTTELTGWSMTKSVTHALIGIAVADGILRLDEPIIVPEWTDPDDPRRAITLDQYLRMSSGLAFGEVYDDFTSDAVVMLMRAQDAAAVAAEQPLEAAPDEVWQYSSGTTNLVSRGLRLAMGDDTAYWRFPYERLFTPLSMNSAVLETDPSGTFVGSSYSYATTRDWARFGLLYLNDGVWGDQRILPEGWVEHGVTPTPAAPQQRYGAHWWLNAGGRKEGVPADEFEANGFDGQFVMVIPSRRTVIVRLGQTPGTGFDSWAFERAVLDALAAEPAGDSEASGQGDVGR